jgi:hypothetical protein
MYGLDIDIWNERGGKQFSGGIIGINLTGFCELWYNNGKLFFAGDFIGGSWTRAKGAFRTSKLKSLMSPSAPNEDP